MEDEKQRVLVPLASMEEGDVHTFTVLDNIGMEQEAILIVHDEVPHAYVNWCPHKNVPLDDGSGVIFDAEAGILACQHHGALFRVDDGVCVEGPCIKACLKALKVEVRDGEIVLLTNLEDEALPDLE